MATSSSIDLDAALMNAAKKIGVNADMFASWAWDRAAAKGHGERENHIRALLACREDQHLLAAEMIARWGDRARA